MKLPIPVCWVPIASAFINLCKYAYDYGYSGFEIYDAMTERRKHTDSVLRNDMLAESRRKLVNRNIAVSALRMPYPVESEETTSNIIPPANTNDATAKNIFFLNGDFDAGTFFARVVST